jgi:hypothetical protein
MLVKVTQDIKKEGAPFYLNQAKYYILSASDRYSLLMKVCILHF